MFYIIICIFARFLPYFPLFIWHQIPIHINPLLTKFACCRAALFSGFSISHIPNIFYVFTSTTLGFCVGRDLSSLFVSFLVSFFFFHILHANRIFLNFNWIFDWLYLCLYTHISFGWIKTLDKFSPPPETCMCTQYLFIKIYTRNIHTYMHRSKRCLYFNYFGIKFDF